MILLIAAMMWLHRVGARLARRKRRRAPVVA